jgi:hypothetical protein
MAEVFHERYADAVKHLVGHDAQRTLGHDGRGYHGRLQVVRPEPRTL